MVFSLHLGLKRVLFIYLLLDILCVGVGMGVPIFSIILGFPLGWYLTKRLYSNQQDIGLVLIYLFKYGFITSFLTFLLMLLIWGMTIPLLWDINANLENFGIPMILYDPRASFVGWLVLMILLSPLLQFMSTIFAGNLTLWLIFKKKNKIKPGKSDFSKRIK